LAVYKASGLVDRLTVSLHPLTRPFGLAGRDLVRVVMGFGCNVPAVINTRSCSSCSRGACVSAISFGSACSYQLPATIAVFAAAGMPYLATWYLVILATSTLVYLRLTVPKDARLATNHLVIKGRDFVHWPPMKAIWRESWGVIKEFFSMALPIFFLICILAALLNLLGFFALITKALAPIMTLFNLPSEASLSVILGSVRKDGIAIGLLDNDWNSLKVGLSTPAQLMTVVYLAGVLLPCLVTLLTVMKEMSSKFALKMLLRQISAASLFAIIIAWGGKIIFA
jgi:Fe2+ transport system protein B